METLGATDTLEKLKLNAKLTSRDKTDPSGRNWTCGRKETLCETEVWTKETQCETPLDKAYP
jgi:hypothetical protein